MAGDTVSLGARAFYKSIGNKQPKTQTPAADMAVALVQAFGGTAATDAHASAGQSGNNTPFNDNFNSNQYQRLKEKDAGNQASLNRPKAYLNFAFFNDQFKLVEDNSGVRQVQESPDQLQTLAADKMVVKESGFLYVYTSNETAQDVFFDNVAVVLEPGAVLEETHYYPFGLTMSGISSEATYKLENKYKLTGQLLDDELGWDTYQMKWRTMDPQIGRFWQIDPLASSYVHNSTYAYAENKVIDGIDLEGLEHYRTVSRYAHSSSYYAQQRRTYREVNSYVPNAQSYRNTNTFTSNGYNQRATPANVYEPTEPGSGDRFTGPTITLNNRRGQEVVAWTNIYDQVKEFVDNLQVTSYHITNGLADSKSSDYVTISFKDKGGSIFF